MKQIDADFVSGLVFLAISVAFGILAAGYGFGTALRLGAGVFPLAVSVLLAIIGIALVLQSMQSARSSSLTDAPRKDGQPILASDIRSLLFIALSLLFGAWTLRRFGLAIAVPGTVLIASLASREFRLIPALILALALTAFTYTIFVAGIGVRLPLIAGLL